LVDYYSGQQTEARIRWEMVLRLEPGHQGALRALAELR
jgi:hypothetical protein